ncbi:MAG TPA: N-acetylmuramoyl-L-alanine amidase [Acidobacteriaceae bacterium]|nr:N-acetylmuramoyl-L-alanine amidase [Acidobacteriaceae bacterium]
MLIRAAKATMFFLAASVVGCGLKAKTTEPASLLKSSTRLFEHLSRRSENTIPDAVLNRTRCVVVIPAIAARTDHLKLRGVATFRETSDQWNTPSFITFEEDGARAHRGDLLIFILQDAGVGALRSGRLQIRARKHSAVPLVSTTPLPSQDELTADLLVYEYAAGVLSGSSASGVVRLDDKNVDASNRIHGEVSDKINNKYLSSVVSFFNTIMPTGIVIHHTAIIPGENALPRNERDVDKFHQTRGFEITCSGHIYHVAYHYLILPDGHVQAGRPERCEGAHAEGYNSYLGIALVGDFSSEDNPTGKKGPTSPSEKQMHSLVHLCLRLMDRYNIPLQHIMRHSDISSTRCPGDRFPFNSLLRQLQDAQSRRIAIHAAAGLLWRNLWAVPF